MSLRPPSTPRASLVPSHLSGAGSTPSSLPTPSRRRVSAASSTSSSRAAALTASADELDSLQQALRSNDPARYDSPLPLQHHGHESPTPNANETVTTRRGSALRRPSTLNLRSTLGVSGLGSSSGSRPTTPSGGNGSRVLGMSTPRTPSHPRSKTPTAVVGFGNSVGPRPLSRSTNNALGVSMRGLQVGDAVKFEVAGTPMEGTVRFLGEVDGKDGKWGGVELDPEWSGMGKNDGSVKGVQYFACPPQCGLFLPLPKISKKPPAAPTITAGSRASKYVGLKASELVTNKRSAAMGPPASPTKGAPRRSLAPPSPEKVTTASAASTPRAIRTSRPSIGGFGVTPRKSMGGSTWSSVTPRASYGGFGGSNSIKRPPSAMRSNVPDVPALPHSYALARSVTPSSSSRDGRATPSTPSLARRRSEVSSSLGHSQSRPTTPSVRSFSRQSFASSISRTSMRSTTRDEDDVAEFKQQAVEAREREQQVRILLEGSEKVGRELEDQVAALKDQLKASQDKVQEVETRSREKELARLAGIEDDQDVKNELHALHAKVEEMTTNEQVKKDALDKLQREWATKFAAKEGEIDSLRERLEAATKGADQEKLDLQKQLEQLRSAGQALCETYEERIAEIEIARLESVDLAETLAAQLETLQLGGAVAIEKGRPKGDDADGSTSPDSPTRRLGASASASAADMINAESAQADLEHLRAKVGSLEEQLEEARMHLEAEVNDSRGRRTKHQDAEAQLKKELKAMRDALDRGVKNEAKLTARIAELGDALQESQATLEEERSELEGLRNDAVGGASAGIADELKRASKLVISLKNELEEAKQDKLQQAAVVQELKAQLDEAQVKRSSSPAQIPTQDTGSVPSSLHLSPASASADRQVASSTGRRSIGSGHGQDETAAAKEQIVGLKAIIKSLEDDNAALAEQKKSLANETQELKESQKALEVTVENLMAAMTSGATGANNATTKTVPTSPTFERKGLQAIKEVEELKLKMREVEKKAEREIKILHQEVNELESLVESKIYREDELETELEKYKALAAKAGASGKSPKVSSTSRSNGGPTAAPAAASKTAVDADADDDEGECEMCGDKHDLDSCPIFAGSSSASPSKSSSRHAQALSVSSNATSRSGSAGEAYCDDCEEYGHALEDCPLANDIF